MSSPSDARAARPPVRRSWLEVRTSPFDARGRRTEKASVHISVQKKIVRLATDRNRLKRLLREALRGQVFFKSPGTHTVKVTGNPLPSTLERAKAELERALAAPRKV